MSSYPDSGPHRNQSSSPADQKQNSRPKILEIFSQLWGTHDLIASFDGVNVSHPVNPRTGRTDMEPTQAWPRMTKAQSTTRRSDLGSAR